MKFREETERYSFTKIGEKMSPNAFLSFLGKALPFCSYTSSSQDAVLVPVDGDQSNLLPSNVDYISKSFLMEGGKKPVIIAEVSVDNVVITLFAMDFVVEESIRKIKEMFTIDKLPENLIISNTETAYALWDYLTVKNIKGLLSVAVKKYDVKYQVEAGFFMQRILNKEESRQKLSGISL